MKTKTITRKFKTEKAAQKFAGNYLAPGHGRPAKGVKSVVTYYPQSVLDYCPPNPGFYTVVIVLPVK